MQHATFLASTISLLFSLANPAPNFPPPENPPPLGVDPQPPNGVTIPAVVPTSLASQVASAIASSIPVAIPTNEPLFPSTPPSDLIPGLTLPPDTVLENVEACVNILGIVITLLRPEYAIGAGEGEDEGGDDGEDGEGGSGGGGEDEDGGEDYAKPGIDGKLITTLVQTAAGLLSLVPEPGPNA